MNHKPAVSLPVLRFVIVSMIGLALGAVAAAYFLTR